MGGVKTDAIVLHGKLDGGRLIEQAYMYSRRAGMARYIGQALLQDAIDGGCKRLGKFKMPGYDLQFALNTVAPLK